MRMFGIDRGGGRLLRFARCSAAVVALLLWARADAKPGDPPPAGLMASIAIGPVSTLQGVMAYVEAIQPGATASVTDEIMRTSLAKLVAADSLDGLDPAAWLHLLVVATPQGAPAIALVSKVADAKTLGTSVGSASVMIKGSWAVIGAKPVLDRVGGYALATIAAQPAPTVPTAIVYLPQVVARYKTELAMFRDQMMKTMSQTKTGGMARFMTSYLDGFASLAADSDKVIVTLDATPDSAAFDLALIPRAGSRLAAFTAAQKPSSYALLDQLPAGITPPFLIGGHLELGPYRDGMLAAMATMYGSDVSKDLLAAMDAVRKAFTGDMAMAMDIGEGTGMSFTQLYGTSDPVAAGKALGRLLDLFKTGRTITMAELSTTITSSPDQASYDGVALRSYDTTYDMSKATPAQRRAMEAMTPGGTHRGEVAAFDRLTMAVVASDSLAEAKRTIDAARGKTAHFVASKADGALLAASRARKDSLALVMDLGLLAAAATGVKATELPMLLSLGFADHNAHTRLTLPVASLRGMMKMAKP